MQEIAKIIEDMYYIDVRSIVPFKDVHIINTPGSKRILKKSPLQPGRILFVHCAKEHLYKNNFKNIDRYALTIDNLPYFMVDGSCYTVFDMVEGRECNFDAESDVVRASGLLASIHKASKGYIPPENSRFQDELGKIPSYFSRRLDELKKLKKFAKRGRNKFDYLFLDHVDYFYGLGEHALLKIDSSCYRRAVETARQESGFCHHDFTHHNIIFRDDEIFAINFDYCCVELKVYDLANFLRRKMRKCDWSVAEAKKIISEYRSIEQISDDELYVMKFILQFPQKFWRVANRYYNSRRSLSDMNFITKLQEAIDEKEYHRQFMDNYEQIVT